MTKEEKDEATRLLEKVDTHESRSGLTTDPSDPRLGKGADEEPRQQNSVYLIASAEERAKGFVRPVRHTYKHVGQQPKYKLRPLSDDEKARYAPFGYVAYEEYPESEAPMCGRFWTQKQLDAKGCGGETTMARELAETYARNPRFYGATYCVHCQKHRPVEEFVWADGTRVGS